MQGFWGDGREKCSYGDIKKREFAMVGKRDEVAWKGDVTGAQHLLMLSVLHQ